ncbi:serine/threonine protein kinase [Acidipropionibacterium jensenii]|uniref:non-specific serine/threonine protein kinase n=1 Tax=Acidipropionibacterium jensenii TaxID=1749 RepID=A0A3Q9UMM8_9ACTN|nr:serine/threonine protein kinase [Acidipropionibacterium jensenii]
MEVTVDSGYNNGYRSTVDSSPDDSEDTRSREWSEDREVPDAVPLLSVGAQLGGRFRLEQELGRPLGTMTWRAFDLKLHRPVLMHILASNGAHTTEVLAAARRAAVATDSRFLRVLDAVAAGPGDPGAYIVCEFAPGRSISELLQSGPLSALEAAWIVRELADALAPLHSQGIFHERLNPDNVIVTSTGNVKIVGLLIQAALHPWPGDQSLSWSDREARDVSDMGRLLYACLVSRWPAGTARSPRPTSTRDGRVRWGLVPAPADQHGWLPPRQVRAGVSPALDVLCDQILSEVPRHNEVPIRTANEVAQALTRVLGSADAAADLERRLRYPSDSATTVTTSLPTGSGSSAGFGSSSGFGSPGGPSGSRSATGSGGADRLPDRDGTTARQPAVGADGLPVDYSAGRAGGFVDDDGTGSPEEPVLDEDGYWTPEAAAGEWAHVPAPRHPGDGADLPRGAGSPARGRSSRRGTGGRSDRGGDAGFSASGSSASGRRSRSGRSRSADPLKMPAMGRIRPEDVEQVSHDLAQPRPSSRRWQVLLVAAVAVVLVICLIVVGVRRGTGSDSAGEAAVSPGSTISISKVDDFDPQRDGGNDEENPDQVALAWDGKPATAWKTLVYRGSPKLGRLKPGVGLVVDLGQDTRFSSVTVTLVNGATDVGLYVPSGSSRRAPMSSINDWTRVAGDATAQGTTTLKPSDPTSSRYLLVYLTSLPRIGQGRYQGGIAEIKVNP